MHTGVDAAEPALTRNWAFQHSEPHWKKRVRRLEGLVLRRSRRPAVALVKPVFPAPRWTVFFAYCPEGRLTPSQRFSLQRLADLGDPILIVAATREPSVVPRELTSMGSALYWKATTGYDFSAYTIALEAIADRSEGSAVFVMNDSVFGPFHDARAQAASAPWGLTGWTACGKFENHVQSYAFSFKEFNRTVLDRLRPIFFRGFAFNDPLDVVRCQETRLARVASRFMSAGALWCPVDANVDATVDAPFALLREEFPFLKKSLLGKYKKHQSQDEVFGWLEHHRHPIAE